MKDLTVVAIPFYFGSMGAEYLWMRNREETLEDSAGSYERRDTLASLSMGVGSLLGPLVMPKLLKNFVPGKGRHGRLLLRTAAGAAAVTTAADLVCRLAEHRAAAPGAAAAAEPGDTEQAPDTAEEAGDDTLQRLARLARPVAAGGGVATLVAGGLAVVTSWSSLTATSRLARRRVLRKLGKGPAAVALAVRGWDFIYYWNHRAMHESRFMWAIHVVHHSSERYNLSTALRQPVADAFGTFLPYGALT